MYRAVTSKFEASDSTFSEQSETLDLVRPRDVLDQFDKSDLVFLGGSDDIISDEMPSKSTKIRPSTERKRASFNSLQEWEGTVSKIDKETFCALLFDVTAGRSNPVEEMEFPVSDIGADSLPLFREGAVFRWSIGYRIENGTKERSSQIVFRRLPAWTASDLAAASKRASELAKSISWD